MEVQEELRQELQPRDEEWTRWSEEQRALARSDREWADGQLARLRRHLGAATEANEEMAAQQAQDRERFLAWCRVTGNLPTWLQAEAEARGQIQPHASMLAFILPPIPQ